MAPFVAVMLTRGPCSPKSVRKAASSAGSPSGVLVAWALTVSMAVGGRPALARARRAARRAPAPPGAGRVTSTASDVAPYPTTSARIGTSRRWAWPASSRTSMAAPSAATNPSRPWSNGREAPAGSSLRVESARMAAKAPTKASKMGASEPPAIIISASPRRMISVPSPMACAAAGAGADRRVRRPLRPEDDGDLAGGHVADGHGDEERADAVGTAGGRDGDLLHQRARAAHARRHQRAGLLGHGALEAGRQAGLGHRLPRRHQGELGEAVGAPQLLAVEDAGGVQVLHLAGDAAGEAGRGRRR